MSFDVAITLERGARSITARIAQDAPLVALVGPSGVGKTSVLHAIAGLLRPSAGHIAVAGDVLFDSARGIELAPEARGCGYVFQDSRLFPHMRVSANLDYAERLASNPPPLARADLIDLLEIAPLLQRAPATLSGGETRRVAIARAILAAPHMLLLDEPQTSLDPARREQVLTMIERIRDALSIPTLFVGHDLDDVARLTDHVVTLSDET